MHINEIRKELPWAYPKKNLKDFTGAASGLYFHFFETESEAKKSYAYYLRKGGKDYGPVRHYPGQAYRLCWISL